MPIIAHKPAPARETVFRAETSKPFFAHPKLPVHLENVEYARNEAGALVKTGRRDWVGSFATEELAQGHAQKRREGF